MQRLKKTALITAAAAAGLASLGLIGTDIVSAQTKTGTTTTTSTGQLGMGPHGQAQLEAMASELGITTTQLQTELQSDKQFYQIAAARGVTYDKLVQAQEARVASQLADEVKVGFLTQAGADTELQQFKNQASQQPLTGDLMGGGFHIRGPGLE